MKRRLARGLTAIPKVGLFIFCVSMGVLTLFAGVAGADAPTLVANGYFNATAASGVAVDQASGDVFVAGFIGSENGEGLIFGGPIAGFSASGARLGPSPFASGLYYGVATNPANGHLYVANFSGAIEVYDSGTGELLSSFTVPPFFTGSEGLRGLFENEAQIATDAVGDVYVPVAPENKVFEYNETGELLHEFSGLQHPTAVAVDSFGNVWVADHGDNRIEELSPSGSLVHAFESEGVRTLALDGHGHVLAIVQNGADNCETLAPPCEHLVQYSESGSQLDDIGAGTFGIPQSNLRESMVAVGQANGRVYVTDGMKGRVWIFQPPVPPALGQESAVEEGTTEAKLGAVINPGGVQATYHFEYDTRAYGEHEGSHGVSVPSPDGSVGEGFSSRTVWASAKGLAPDTTYDYRVVATNALGTVVGPNETFTTETAALALCPNEQERRGFSAPLPDCRAYELVTLPSKASAQPDYAHVEFSANPRGGFGGNYAADDGERFSYVSLEVMPGVQSAGLEFVSTRGALGWRTEDEIPLQPYGGDRCTIKENSHVLTYSADLSRAIIEVGNTHAGNLFRDECSDEVVEVVPGEPLGQDNLLLRDNEDGSYQLIDVTPPGVTSTTPTVDAWSADLDVVIFSERAKLTPEAQDNVENVYEWRNGAVHLLQFRLPSGAPVSGKLVSFSPDGTEMFFTAAGKLYVSLDGGRRTVQIDEPRGGSGPGGGGSFVRVTADGSRVFFTDNATAGLTSDTVPGSGTNLYSYEIATGQLSDVTPFGDANATLVGIGETGSYLYFDSPAGLTGSEVNQFGERAEAGRVNLYVDHEGAITFVMHSEGGAISANGAFLAFETRAKLTAYDNEGANEIYLYSTGANRFACASCNPSGQAPSVDIELSVGSPRGVPHPVSNNGQVFFQTTERLLPRDTSGATEVYEFDWSSGLHLISSGTSEARLLDASTSGDDVFFLTTQGLVAQDSLQEANKIYDARVGGGFVEPVPPPECTTADACRSAPEPQPLIYGAPSSQTFSGAGDLASTSAAKPTAKTKSKPVKCRKGFVKKRGRCAVKSRKKARKSTHTHRTGK